MGKIINLKEAARRLGVTDQTIKNWIAKGAISMKRVGGAQYVDEDTVAALQDTAEDIERQKRILEQLREQQRQETKEFWNAIHDKESRRRYYALCVETGIRTEFFATILEMMEYYGTLSAREAAVMKDRLNGETLDEIGRKFGLTRERVRQITEKAIRRSRDLMWFKEKMNRMREIEADHEALTQTVRSLKHKLEMYETHPELTHEDLMAITEKCDLLSKNMRDCEFTVRAMSCMKAADIETIADLVRCKREQLLTFRNFGKKSLNELDDFIYSHGLEWGMNVDEIYRQRAEMLLQYENK